MSEISDSSHSSARKNKESKEEELEEQNKKEDLNIELNKGEKPEEKSRRFKSKSK